MLHAVEPDLYASNVGGGPVPGLQLMNLQIERENLHKYAERIPDLRTVKHKEIAFLGSPGDAIQSAGQANNIDLLVLGSHGRHGLAKLALGSIAEWVIRRLEYPVLVAGPLCVKAFRPIRSIVLATDFSPEALRSVHYASSLAQDYNATLTVMNVLSHASAPEEQSQNELSSMKKLRELLPSACGDEFTLQYQVRTGEIAPAVIDVAREGKSEFNRPGCAPSAHLGRSRAAEQTIGHHSQRPLPCTQNPGSPPLSDRSAGCDSSHICRCCERYRM